MSRMKIEFEERFPVFYLTSNFEIYEEDETADFTEKEIDAIDEISREYRIMQEFLHARLGKIGVYDDERMSEEDIDKKDMAFNEMMSNRNEMQGR